MLNRLILMLMLTPALLRAEAPFTWKFSLGLDYSKLVERYGAGLEGQDSTHSLARADLFFSSALWSARALRYDLEVSMGTGNRPSATGAKTYPPLAMD